MLASFLAGLQALANRAACGMEQISAGIKLWLARANKRVTLGPAAYEAGDSYIYKNIILLFHGIIRSNHHYSLFLIV